MMPETWPCHICKSNRTDEMIEVYKRHVQMVGNGTVVPVQINVRYCKDKETCRVGALNFSPFQNLTFEPHYQVGDTVEIHTMHCWVWMAKRPGY